MKRTLYKLILPSVLLCIIGCRATRGAREASDQRPKVTFSIVDGLIDSILDAGSDETHTERYDRERMERSRDLQWKEHWRYHPEDSRVMHEAFKDDYE